MEQPITQAPQPASTAVGQGGPVTPPVPTKSNKLPKMLPWILVIILTGITGFLAYQNYLLNQKVNLLTYPTQPLATSTPIADPTTNWKTYTSNQYGFSFKYPNQFRELSSKEGGISGSVSGNFQMLTTIVTQDFIVLNNDAAFDGFNVEILPNTNTQTLDQFTAKEVETEKNSPRGVENSTITNITIGGQKAAYIDSEVTIRRYFVMTPDKKNIIVLNRIKKTDAFQTTFDQILSTFKFTDSGSTLNWKIYTNKNFGFSLQYAGTGDGPEGNQITCGNAISEDQTGQGWQITFENYFGIFVINTYSNVKDYLDKNNLSSIITAPISVQGSDEAYKITSSGTSLQYLLRKGSTLVRIDKNNGVLKGCFPPTNWDISKHFYFQ